MPVSASTTTVTPSSPADVIWSVLAPTASRRFLAISLICLSVTWNGLFSSQLRSSSMPSWTWSERLSMFSITCQVTNQPIRPMITNPRIAVSAVAGPRGTPCRRSQATAGWSSAVISSAATNASTTSCTALMTRISTHTVPASTSSRQPASAATRTPQGTACAGSGRLPTAAARYAPACSATGSAAARSNTSSSWGAGGRRTWSEWCAGPSSASSRRASSRRCSNRSPARVSPAPSRPSHPGTRDMIRPLPPSFPTTPPGVVRSDRTWRERDSPSP
ncbi:hypothetical protein SVIOM342S_08102 [Streptomyces violaceorubidus]